MFDEPAIWVQFSSKGHNINNWTAEDFHGLNVVGGNEIWQKGSEALNTKLAQNNIEYTANILLEWAKKQATRCTITTITTTKIDSETTTTTSNNSTEKKSSFWKSPCFIMVLILGFSLVIGALVARLYVVKKTSDN